MAHSLEWERAVWDNVSAEEKQYAARLELLIHDMLGEMPVLYPVLVVDEHTSLGPAQLWEAALPSKRDTKYPRGIGMRPTSPLAFLLSMALDHGNLTTGGDECVSPTKGESPA